MGQELYERCPAYREALEEALAAIDPHLGRPLADLLFSEAGSSQAELLENTAYAQPALFATELALHRQLQSQGLGQTSSPATLGRDRRRPPRRRPLVSRKPAGSSAPAARRLMASSPEGGAMVASRPPRPRSRRLSSLGREQALDRRRQRPCRGGRLRRRGPGAGGGARALPQSGRQTQAHGGRPRRPLAQIEPMRAEPFAAVLAPGSRRRRRRSPCLDRRRAS